MNKIHEELVIRILDGVLIKDQLVVIFNGEKILYEQLII